MQQVYPQQCQQQNQPNYYGQNYQMGQQCQQQNQPNYYGQNYQMGQQCQQQNYPNYQDQNYQMGQYQSPQQFQQITPQQIFVQPQQQIKDPMYMPSPVMTEPQIISPTQEDQCTQNMQTWTKSRLSQELFCSNCKKVIKTQISYQMGKGSWCLLLCCGILPLVLDSMKDVKHTCPNCNKQCGHNVFLC